MSSLPERVLAAERIFNFVWERMGRQISYRRYQSGDEAV